VPPGAGEPDRVLKALLTPEELQKRIEERETKRNGKN
jgi:hypothetical protein